MIEVVSVFLIEFTADWKAGSSSSFLVSFLNNLSGNSVSIGECSEAEGLVRERYRCFGDGDLIALEGVGGHWLFR